MTAEDDDVEDTAPKPQRTLMDGTPFRPVSEMTPREEESARRDVQRWWPKQNLYPKPRQP
ncbi:MAG TPA: hypothetical protein VGL02_16920 [Streptomyces sp.]